jgi:phage-related protein (TIGR01555 family)
MGTVTRLFDRLANVMSGMGTSVDRRSHASYVFTPLTHQQAEAAYRSSWLVRKIVDIPAKDMTRTWRDWQADDAQIEAIEREERRLQLRPKLQRAVILARLYGGGAIIMGTKDGDPLKEIDLERVGKEGLTYLHVMSRHQLTTGDPVMDPADPWFGHPSYYQIHAPNGLQPKIHPSRVVPLVGQPVPEGAFMKVDRFWGDPIMQSIGEAVKNADTAQAGFASLIEEAKIDIIKMPDLLDNWASDANEQKLLTRLEVAQTGKSIWRQLLLDGEEEWEQRQINWAGIPDIMRAFLEAVAGAADIPVTRLLGQSPKGLQSTGDGEERDYHSKVRADQDEILAPALDRIDDLLIRSALGSRPDEIYFEWSPLVETSEKDGGAIEKQAAETLKIYADTGILGSEQVTAIAQNRMIEVGRWPGCEAAFEEKPDPVDEENDEDPEAALAAVTTAAERQAGRASNVVQLRKAGAVTADQATLLIADARPRSLYIQRKLLNAGDFLAWAKRQGFAEPLTADDLHVTVLYSRRPVDWLKAGTSWEQKEDGTLVVPPGGARMVEPLGDKGAVVLLFNSSALAWRHEQLIRDIGASHDFSEYQPHVTITYAGAGEMDLAEVEPYRGQLIFGPEIFEEVDPDWAPKAGAGRKAAGPFKRAEANDYDPNQPRDPGGEGGGQWVRAGEGAFDPHWSEEGIDPAEVIENGKVTAQQKRALRDYSEFAYKEINDALRAGKTHPAVADLDAAIAGGSITRDTLLFRGVEGALPNKGDVLLDLGFASTSTSPGAGANFAGDGYLLSIRVKAGAKALHLNEGLTASTGEQEVLLPRGGHFRVIGFSEVSLKPKTRGMESPHANDYQVVKVEFIPPAEDGGQ